MESDRITYEIGLSKCWETRFLSHLDIMRHVSRSLRRTGLNIYFTEGFNPKPKVTYLGFPLSTGHTSSCEKIRFSICGEQPGEAALLDSLRATAYPGLRVDTVSIVPPGSEKKGVTPLKYQYVMLLRISDGECALDELSGAAAISRISSAIDPAIQKEVVPIAQAASDGMFFARSAAVYEKYFTGALRLEFDLMNGYKKPESYLDMEQLAAAGENIGRYFLYFHRSRAEWQTI